MVSAAMIINYWAEQNQLQFRTTPQELNNWLRSHRGYNADNGVLDAQVVAYAQMNGVPLANPGYSNGRDDPLLDTYLLSGNPVILTVNGTEGAHFVVATGKTTVNGVETYTINDPVFGQTTLLARYSNTYSMIRKYVGTPADMRALRISAHSPVELLVTDPQGRRTGYNPQTGQHWNEIPGASYYVEAIAADDVSSQVNSIESKVLEIYAPLDGSYTVEVHGTGPGAYEIDTFAADWLGRVTSQIQYGQAQEGSLDEIEIEYDSVTGVPPKEDYLWYLPAGFR